MPLGVFIQDLEREEKCCDIMRIVDKQEGSRPGVARHDREKRRKSVAPLGARGLRHVPLQLRDCKEHALTGTNANIASGMGRGMQTFDL